MTYYVGIDLAKYHHECLIINQDGEVVSNTFTFDNNKQGFTSFLSVLSCLNASHQIRIGVSLMIIYLSMKCKRL